MANDTLGLLASLLHYAGQEIVAGQFASSREIDLLVQAGWLVPLGQPATVPCESCDEPHPAEVVDRGPSARALCLRTGDVFCVSAPAALFRPELSAVARSLARSMQLDGEARLVNGISALWRLGGRQQANTRAP